MFYRYRHICSSMNIFYMNHRNNFLICTVRCANRENRGILKMLYDAARTRVLRYRLRTYVSIYA